MCALDIFRLSKIEEGKYFIIFDQKGNHKTVLKALHTLKLHITEVSSYLEKPHIAHDILVEHKDDHNTYISLSESVNLIQKDDDSSDSNSNRGVSGALDEI
jgi:hypothetical protein